MTFQSKEIPLFPPLPKGERGCDGSFILVNVQHIREHVFRTEVKCLVTFLRYVRTEFPTIPWEKENSCHVISNVAKRSRQSKYV